MAWLHNSDNSATTRGRPKSSQKLSVVSKLSVSPKFSLNTFNTLLLTEETKETEQHEGEDKQHSHVSTRLKLLPSNSVPQTSSSRKEVLDHNDDSPPCLGEAVVNTVEIDHELAPSLEPTASSTATGVAFPLGGFSLNKFVAQDGDFTSDNGEEKRGICVGSKSLPVLNEKGKSIFTPIKKNTPPISPSPAAIPASPTTTPRTWSSCQSFLYQEDVTFSSPTGTEGEEDNVVGDEKDGQHQSHPPVQVTAFLLDFKAVAILPRESCSAGGSGGSSSGVDGDVGEGITLIEVLPLAVSLTRFRLCVHIQVASRHSSEGHISLEKYLEGLTVGWIATRLPETKVALSEQCLPLRFLNGSKEQQIGWHSSTEIKGGREKAKEEEKQEKVVSLADKEATTHQRRALRQLLDDVLYWQPMALVPRGEVVDRDILCLLHDFSLFSRVSMTKENLPEGLDGGRVDVWWLAPLLEYPEQQDGEPELPLAGAELPENSTPGGGGQYFALSPRLPHCVAGGGSRSYPEKKKKKMKSAAVNDQIQSIQKNDDKKASDNKQQNRKLSKFNDNSYSPSSLDIRIVHLLPTSPGDVGGSTGESVIGGPPKYWLTVDEVLLGENSNAPRNSNTSSATDFNNNTITTLHNITTLRKLLEAERAIPPSREALADVSRLYSSPVHQFLSRLPRRKLMVNSPAAAATRPRASFFSSTSPSNHQQEMKSSTSTSEMDSCGYTHQRLVAINRELWRLVPVHGPVVGSFHTRPPILQATALHHRHLIPFEITSGLRYRFPHLGEKSTKNQILFPPSVNSATPIPAQSLLSVRPKLRTSADDDDDGMVEIYCTHSEPNLIRWKGGRGALGSVYPAVEPITGQRMVIKEATAVQGQDVLRREFVNFCCLSSSQKQEHSLPLSVHIKQEQIHPNMALPAAGVYFPQFLHPTSPFFCTSRHDALEVDEIVRKNVFCTVGEYAELLRAVEDEKRKNQASTLSSSGVIALPRLLTQRQLLRWGMQLFRSLAFMHGFRPTAGVHEECLVTTVDDNAAASTTESVMATTVSPSSSSHLVPPPPPPPPRTGPVVAHLDLHGANIMLGHSKTLLSEEGGRRTSSEKEPVDGGVVDQKLSTSAHQKRIFEELYLIDLGCGENWPAGTAQNNCVLWRDQHGCNGVNGLQQDLWMGCLFFLRYLGCRKGFGDKYYAGGFMDGFRMKISGGRSKTEFFDVAEKQLRGEGYPRIADIFRSTFFTDKNAASPIVQITDTAWTLYALFSEAYRAELAAPSYPLVPEEEKDFLSTESLSQRRANNLKILNSVALPIPPVASSSSSSMLFALGIDHSPAVLHRNMAVKKIPGSPIRFARYHNLDVTAEVQHLILKTDPTGQGKLLTYPDGNHNAHFGDPAYGVPKELFIELVDGRKFRFKEGEKVYVQCA